MSFTVKISQWPTPITVAAGQTVLDAALDQGVPYPHGCQSGNCGACKSRLYSGEVELEPYSDFALEDSEREAGFILACRALPQGDLELAWQQDDGEAVAHALRRLDCQVVAIRPVTHDIVVITLERPAASQFEFTAGQYARLTFAGQPARDYSMANRPDEPALEFHIRLMPEGRVSAYAAQSLKTGDTVHVEGPFGSSYLRERHRGPIIAIAGGSGLAPIKSIVETALAKALPQPIHLYFGVRDERDLYLEEHFRALAGRHPTLTFVPVLSDPSGATDRRTGFVHAAVAHDFGDLDGCKAYLAGPPVMVEAATRMLVTRDTRREDIHADAFYTEAEKAANKP